MRALVASVAILFVVISAFADRTEIRHQEVVGRVISVDRELAIQIKHEGNGPWDPRPIVVDVTRDTIFESEERSSKLTVAGLRTGQRVQVRFHMPPGATRYEADRVILLKAR